MDTTLIPNDLNIDELPGIQRGIHPALYFHDEIVWNESQTYFALAYTIFEASMGNYVGSVLLASYKQKRTEILYTLTELNACCWGQPWCKWIDEQTIVFKAQVYDGKHTNLPLVAANINSQFSIIEDTNSPDSRPEDIKKNNFQFEKLDHNILRERICVTNIL